MRQSHLMLSNAVIIWATQILLLVPQLIMVPFLIHRIGDAGYGVYVLVWSLMLSIDRLEKSLQSGVVKYSAAFLAEKRIGEVNKVISSSFIYSIVLAVLACAAMLAATSFFGDQSGDIIFCLVVVGVMVLLMVPLTPYIAIIQSRQRYYVGAIAETLSKYATLLAAVLWFNMVGPSVEALIVISAGMLLLSRLAQVPLAYRFVSGLRNSPSSFDWRTFRRIVSFGGVIVLVGLCLIVNTTGVRWLMGVLVSTSFVAHLAIILMPGILLSQMVLAMTLTIMPATSAYEATGNHQMLQELLIRGIRYSTILVLAGVIAAALLMRNVLAMWVGPQYEFLGGYALAIFCSVSFMLSTSTAHHMLKGMGQLRTTLFNSLVGLVIVPIGLIPIVFLIWRNPYTAVTVGLVTGNIVYGILQIGFGMKAVHADFRGVFMRAYGQPLIVGAIVGSLALGVVTCGGIGGLIGRAFVLVLAILLCLIGIYAFVASLAERQQFKEFLQLGLKHILAIVGILGIAKP